MTPTPAHGGTGSDIGLPDYDDPPVVEVALGVQFQPLFGLRPIELADLRERWREEFPSVSDQPPLPPVMEQPAFAPRIPQIIVGPAMQTRLWFISEDECSLIQVQHDRLTVNWRKSTENTQYPRFPAVRALFERRFGDLQQFVADREMGELVITQVEATYINAIDTDVSESGDLHRILRNWSPPSDHHLSEPEQARANLAFLIPGMGLSPVRLYVGVETARRVDEQPQVLLTLMVRGSPTNPSIESALEFMDQAHGHIVNSFTELTPTLMHSVWKRTR